MTDIERLMNPRSMAVIGVTDKEGSFGQRSGANALKSHIRDRVYFVHPRRESCMGKKCYKDLKELPEVVDCILICTPASTVNSILREAGELGVKGAVVYASGFSEDHTPEGIAMEKEMEDIARTYDMKVVGPNCLGIINNVNKIMMWGLGALIDLDTRPTGIGIIAQSGFIAANIVQLEQFNISYAVSTGNGNCFTLDECLEYLVDNDNVKVCALYLEGIKDASTFCRALEKAAKKRKPVIVLKSGVSEKGAKSAASHTGNLAGSAGTYRAVFKKYGVVTVDSLEELLCTAQMYSVLNGRLPKVNGFAGINFSGGENTICADLCEKYHVRLPDLEESTLKEIRNYIPPFAAAKNPLDGTTSLFTDREKVYNVIKAMGEDPEVGGVLVGMNVAGPGGVPQKEITSMEAMIQISEMENAPALFAVPSYEGDRDKAWRQKLESHGIPVMSSAETAYKALGKLGEFVEFQWEKSTLAISAPDKAPSGEKSAMTEWDSKLEIQRLGIPIPAQGIAAVREDVPKVVGRMKFPVAMKVNSPDILHKTDAGGVRLNVKSSEEAMEAFDSILANCRRYMPDARLDGIIIQEMASPGLEMIIGVTNDPQFGPVLLAGLGGIFVEIFKDVALCPCPVNTYEALEMLRQLKAYKMLEGYRGSRPCDLKALTDIMVKVSQYALEHKNTIAEMDLNPVFVYEEGMGAIAIDALIVAYGDR